MKNAEVSKLFKKQYMQNLKRRMARWDEYALLKTARELGEEKGFQKGFQKSIEEAEGTKSYVVVKNLLETNKLSIAEITRIAIVTEASVKKVRRSLQK